MAAEPVSLLCRLCAQQCLAESEHTSIDDSKIRFKLDTVFNFEIASEELLPKLVCQECLATVTTWYTYHETVRSNQSQLTDLETAELGSTEELDVKLPLDFVKVETEEDDCHAEEMSEAEADSREEEEQNQSDPGEGHEESRLRKRPKRVNSVKPGKRKYTKRSAVVKSKPKTTKNRPAQMEEENKKIQEFFKLACDICSQPFEAFYQLQLHTRRVHNTRAGIKCCNRVMYRKFIIIDHIDSHLNPTRFYCALCDKYYPGRQNLERHNVLRHTNIKKPFKCDKCNHSFHKKYMLEHHLLQHDPQKCMECDKMFVSSFTLRAHMVNMHGDNLERKKLICETCGEEFRTKQSMDRHTRKHLGLDPVERVQCHICSKYLNSKSYLKTHIQTQHTEEDQSVACDICGGMYPHNRALKTHKRLVHIEEKFECEFCGKKFKRKINLTEHRASHTGQPLYSCNVCGITSNSNANLYSHKKSKHPQEWLEAKQKAASQK